MPTFIRKRKSVTRALGAYRVYLTYHHIGLYYVGNDVRIKSSFETCKTLKNAIMAYVVMKNELSW